ncbi:hypothetical protein [Chenggangzhangella methanolivorans]|uniref:PsiF repeat-containing protein n=1 Tax=Chenggangzhangella methanolivorans TaxID=1437009 RepID=A0A9E6R907_9HYPH|nr:hypothetical protein [Chenggangzhangella methanolivorans]QZO00299.1 hypothetical protein K6K41_00395 [Chenggangzhangella methanolivorans]
MRTTAAMLALAIIPFSTPSFAAPSAEAQIKHVEACNEIADRHDVTGYARSSFVQKCLEHQSAKMDRSTARGANG